MTVEVWILISIWFLAIGALLGTAHLRNWRITRRKLRMPVAEKLLRGPGESLRKKLEDLDEQLSQEMAMAFVLPLVYVSPILLQERKLHIGWGGINFLVMISWPLLPGGASPRFGDAFNNHRPCLRPVRQ